MPKKTSATVKTEPVQTSSPVVENVVQTTEKKARSSKSAKATKVDVTLASPSEPNTSSVSTTSLDPLATHEVGASPSVHVETSSGDVEAPLAEQSV